MVNYVKVDKWYESMYNQNTDTIYYSDSLTKRHESRHRWQIRESRYFRMTALIMQWFPIYAILAALYDANNIGQAVMGLYIGYIIGLEMDAWIYAKYPSWYGKRIRA